MRDMKLVEASVIVDDDTGCYEVGELDFGVPGTTVPWLDKQVGRRKKLAEWLRWLADQCEKGESPFTPETLEHVPNGKPVSGR